MFEYADIIPENIKMIAEIQPPCLMAYGIPSVPDPATKHLELIKLVRKDTLRSLRSS